MNDCIFCKIANKEIPSEIVLEDELFVAFRDIHPKAVQHVLVIPRQHLTSLNDVGQWTSGEGQALLEFVVRTARQLGIADSGYRVLTNVGPDAGQEVQHLHVHILGGEDLGDFH